MEAVASSDPPEVIQMFKSSLQRVPRPMGSNRRIPAETTVSNEFPWGRVMSWTMLKDLLENHPTHFVREWTINPSWNLDSEGQATRLFINFTRDVWLSIAESFVSATLLPDPGTLNEAMYAWSLLSVRTLLGEDKVHFIPSTHALQGQLPPMLRRDASFAQRRAIFFPQKNQLLDSKSAWCVLALTKGGYIHRYHQFIANNSAQAVAKCHETLDSIFSHIQCLPSFQPKSTATKLSGPIWICTNHKVVLITNSEHYRVERVKPVTTEIHRPTRSQASVAIVEARLKLEHQGIPMQFTLRSRRRQKKVVLRCLRSSEEEVEKDTCSDTGSAPSRTSSRTSNMDSDSK